jgi:integrase
MVFLFCKTIRQKIPQKLYKMLILCGLEKFMVFRRIFCFFLRKTICFTRKKLKSRNNLKPTLFRFSADIEVILKRRPTSGQLFPYLCTLRAGDRATEFKQWYVGLGISGVSLHCYRYAWAERALKYGFPERFAQQALGHNSKAVHRAYAKHAEVTVPSLADLEKDWQESPKRNASPVLLPVNFGALLSALA